MTKVENPEGYAVVEIEWVDSAGPGDGGWRDMDEVVAEEFICYSAGYLVEETDEVVKLVGSIDDGAEHCLGQIVIPKVCIKHMEILKDSEEHVEKLFMEENTKNEKMD